ncbi:MAG: hypothetical protein GF320_08035 [Armatimonadia bacterium]|nr:hypothetical protein [Armatimonadia bacterium]
MMTLLIAQIAAHALGAPTGVPLDAEGLYWAELPEGVPAPPVPDDVAPLEGGTVTCELVDYLDCSNTEPIDTDEAGSRVIELLDQPYRVTSASRELGWFSYEMDCRPIPGRPHLLIAQLPDDRERYTSITLTCPDGWTWAPPYEGEEEFKPDNQEEDGVSQDVGGAVYTGREIPLTDEPFVYPLLFYPKTGRMKVTIAHYGSEEVMEDESGAAVARLWMLAIDEPLPPAPVPEDPERRIGLYVPHPWYLLGHYGCPARTAEQRERGLRAFVEYMRFCGFNLLQLHIINGSDRAGIAWYESEYFDPMPVSLVEELLPLCDEAGIEVAPILTPVLGGHPDINGTNPGEWGPQDWEGDSFQRDVDGRGFVAAFGACVPDPLRPEVQEFYADCVDEIATVCAPYDCVKQIGIRVNGKIGLCYVSRELNEGAQHSGYSEWDLREFREATGIEVPPAQEGAYEWLRERPDAWDEWLEFRCAGTRDLWLMLRDRVRSAREDLTFLVACDLPSETPATNAHWPAGHSALDLLRYHGYDPRMYTEDEGIVVQRGMMVAADRFFYKWGPPITHGDNAWALKDFHYQPVLAREYYRTAEPSQAEFYHNYWEEVPHPDNEFGPTLRTATASPRGWHYFEPAVFSLLEGNCRSLLFMGWERASIGHEPELRQWCGDFLSIPYVEPSPLDRRTRLDSRWGRAQARRYGDARVVASTDHRGGTMVIRQGAGREWEDRHISLRPFEVHVEEARR